MTPLPEPWNSIVQLGGTAGLIAFAIFIVIEFQRGKIVSGEVHLSAVNRHEAEEARLNSELATERSANRQLAERTAAMLAEASQALKEAARGYGFVVERSDQPPSSQLDVATRRAELLADSLDRALRGVEQMVKEQNPPKDD